MDFDQVEIMQCLFFRRDVVSKRGSLTSQFVQPLHLCALTPTAFATAQRRSIRTDSHFGTCVWCQRKAVCRIVAIFFVTILRSIDRWWIAILGWSVTVRGCTRTFWRQRLGLVWTETLEVSTHLHVSKSHGQREMYKKWSLTAYEKIA